MGRQLVVQVSCDRCKNVEHRSLPPSDASEEEGREPTYMFEGTYKGERVVFADLCAGCEATLDNHWKSMSQHLVKKSSVRQRRKK